MKYNINDILQLFKNNNFDLLTVRNYLFIHAASIYSKNDLIDLLMILFDTLIKSSNYYFYEEQIKNILIEVIKEYEKK